MPTRSRSTARSTMRRLLAKRPDEGTFPPGSRHTGMERVLLFLVALVVGGCGAQAAAPGPSGTVSGTNGPFQAQAAPASLAAGGTVHLTLTVSGPIENETGSAQTLRIWAESNQPQAVWKEPRPAS